MSPHFRVKPLDRLVGDIEHAGPRLKRTLGPVQLTSLGHRRHHRRRHLLDGRNARRPAAADHLGAGPALVLSFVAHGDGVRVRGALLRRVRGDGAGRRFGVHLRLCDARRARGLDHRLGPDHRVRRRQRGGGDLVVGLLSGIAARIRRRWPAWLGVDYRTAAQAARRRVPQRAPITSDARPEHRR